MLLLLHVLRKQCGGGREGRIASGRLLGHHGLEEGRLILSISLVCTLTRGSLRRKLAATLVDDDHNTCVSMIYMR